MKIEDAAWFAGLIDGEGTITVFKHEESTGWKLGPILSVVNTDPNIINQVQKLAEGENVNFTLFTRVHANPKHATAYQLNMRNVNYIVKMLNIILPYLIGKKAQAEICLRFCKSRLKNRSDGGRALPYTDKEWKMCKELYALNKKGISRALRD
jgi:hypothetical protein